MEYREYTYDDDRNRLKSLDINRLIDLFMIQIKNIWRVDGLYFQGIEKRFGVDPAGEIDKETWETLAKIEARDLKKIFNIDEIEDIGEFKCMIPTSFI